MEILIEGDYTREDISILEMNFVQEYDSFKNGYNMNNGGFQNNGFESRFLKEDVFYVLSAYEFNSRCGGHLCEMFETSNTTLYRMNHRLSHEEHYDEYWSLSIEEREEIYNELCKTTEFLKNRNSNLKVDTLRKFNKDTVFYILAIDEFVKRKQKYMADFLSCSKNTISSIRNKVFYKNYYDEYCELDITERVNICKKAKSFFNLMCPPTAMLVEQLLELLENP